MPRPAAPARVELPPGGATGGPRPVDELTNAAGRRGAGLQRRARITGCLREGAKSYV